VAAVLDWFRPQIRHAAITEAAPGKTVAPSPNSRSVVRAGYTYRVPPGCLNDVQAGMGGATQTDRKSLMQELYEAYISCHWAWGSVQSIARTITPNTDCTWTPTPGTGRTWTRSALRLHSFSRTSGSVSSMRGKSSRSSGCLSSQSSSSRKARRFRCAWRHYS
jgi:hypothetical protein